MKKLIKWQRACQECGYKGFYSQPNPDNKTESWRDTKCRKCKSEALNYGKEVLVDAETNKVIEIKEDEND